MAQDNDITTITNLIQNYLSQIASSQKELKEQKQMLADALNNDPTYKDHESKAKEAARVKTATKAQILKQPALAQVNEKIKEITSSLKEARESLSNYLQEYQKTTGLSSFESESGEVQQIVFVAKLIRVGNPRKS